MAQWGGGAADFFPLLFLLSAHTHTHTLPPLLFFFFTTEDDHDGEDDDEDEEEDDEPPKKNKGKIAGISAGLANAKIGEGGAAGGQPQPECKQQ